MADEFDSQEKTEDPTQYRIDEFRSKGQVASSKELTSILILSASLLTLIGSSIYIIETLSEYINYMYTINFEIAFKKTVFKTIIIKSFYTAIKCAGPVLIVALVAGVMSNVAQVGFIFAPDVISLKFERINPLGGLKKLFSIRSIAEAIKGVFKFSVIILITWVIMKDDLPQFHGFLHLDMVEVLLQGRFFLGKLGFTILIGLSIVAVADFFWEKYQYKNKLKMSKQEAKEELKEKEGSPEVKQRIRSIQRDISNRRMRDDVKEADVIVTNPTHISIVLKYDKEKMIAPRVTNKGADHLALRIRQLAKEFDIPIVENVSLARTLYKTVKRGEGVPRNLYKVVAEILAYVYKLKRKKDAVQVVPIEE